MLRWSFARAYMRFPTSGVIYLRRAGKIPNQTRISLEFPEGMLEYAVRNLKISDYSRESIIGKKLYPLIPFYIARYERKLENCSADLAQVVADLMYFREKLEEAYERQELAAYEILDLSKFVNTIITHITNGNKAEERLVKIMGGIILETESERLLRVGREEGLKQGIERGIEQGIEQGMEQGLEQGMEQGRQEGILNTLLSLVRDKLLDCAEAAARAGMTEEQFKMQLNR